MSRRQRVGQAEDRPCHSFYANSRSTRCRPVCSTWQGIRTGRFTNVWNSHVCSVRRSAWPALAPTTNFGTNGDPRMQGLIPADYEAFAQSFFAKMANYPTAYCTEAEAAAATFAAATEEGRRLRCPTGAGSQLTSTLRWTTSEDHYLSKMRELFGPGFVPTAP